MGLTFLAPLFLAGALVAAVPVYLHLVQRERKDAVEFPSLMFLQRIPYRSVRRQRIRHWALLALRCLALLLLATAFARPFFRRDAGVGGAGPGATREVVVLLDRSYSMGYGDRWTRAQAAARRTVDGLRPGDRATVVVFDESAEALTEPTTDRARLNSAIGGTAPGSGGTRYAPPLRVAQKLLAESNRPRREVVLVSDFQRRGWEARDDVQLPAGTAFAPVDVSDARTADVAVTTATLHRERPADRDYLVAAARVANSGEVAVANLPVTLSLNGRAVETRRMQLPPRSAATVTFTRVPIPDGETRGTISAAPDALRPDDTFHFTLSPSQELSVLVVEPPDPHPNQSLYIRRVLELSETPPVRLRVKRVGQLAADDFSGPSLIVLNDVAFPQGDAARRLADFVVRGGGLLVVLGEHSTPGAWTGESAARLLPGAVGATVDRTGDAGATLVSVEYAHPVFELFNQPRSGDFATARFFRYRALDVRGGARTDTTAVLARFDDGGIALAERSVGAGRVLVWTSTLDNFWNDLALQPVFLPFVHQLARHAARFTEAKPWFTVGEALDLGRPPAGPRTAGAANVELVAQAPSGARTQLGGRGAPHSLPLREHGFYEVRPLGGTAGSGRTVAVNVDPDEADLSHMDPAELVAAVTKQGAAAQAAAALDATPEEAEQRQTLWWYLLAVAVVLLAGETVMANRIRL
jgi:aerotolerance regulator-like protein/VWA domain-containing protein